MRKIQVNNDDPTTYVISELDGKKYTRITYKHTRRFGIELDEYKSKYNLTTRELICDQLYPLLGYTKKIAIATHGEIEGIKRWDAYRTKQAETNTFEYKNKKYGMTKEEFTAYNLNRSCTLNNLIKRHGQEIGESKWKKYCELQAYAGCSVDYFKEKYGEVEGKVYYDNICNQKACTLSNYIIKYGVSEGTKRYTSRMEDFKCGYSAISQELFTKIYTHFTMNKVYFPQIYNGREYGVFDINRQRCYFYDYVDTTINKCIEFNGDIFHGNPLIYKEDDTPNYYNKNIKCKDMWEYDKIKLEYLKQHNGIDSLVIWEREYVENKPDTIKKCLEFLKNGN